MNEYSWYHTAVLYDQTYVFFELAGSNLVDDFKVSYNVARPYDIPFTPAKVKDYGDLLLEAKANARGKRCLNSVSPFPKEPRFLHVFNKSLFKIQWEIEK